MLVRRLFAIFMALVLGVSMQGAVYASIGMAQDTDALLNLDVLSDTSFSIESDVVYDNSEDDGLSDVERGLARVKSISSFVTGKALSVKQLELIGSSNSASIMTLYYVEEVGLSRTGEVTSRMVGVSESEYFSELESRNQVSQNSGKLVEIYDPENSEPTRTYGEFSMDGGLMQMQIILYYAGTTFDDFHYVAHAAFEWDVMPVKRQVDVFGISRGSNTVTYGDFNAYTQVFENTWQGVANGNVIPYDPNASHWIESYPTNDATNDYHYSFKYLLPSDYSPGQVMYGTWVVFNEYEGLYGECAYTGSMDNYSYIPGGMNVINFNNWATYAHSNGFWSISLAFGADVSYPTSVSAGFSVTPSWNTSFITNRLTHLTTVTIS